MHSIVAMYIVTEVVEETEVSPPPLTKVDDESDVSDVEQEGYCDDSQRDNIKMSMKLEPVRDSVIKELYANTEKASNTVITVAL